jgi:hypothetical protein
MLNMTKARASSVHIFLTVRFRLSQNTLAERHTLETQSTFPRIETALTDGLVGRLHPTRAGQWSYMHESVLRLRVAVVTLGVSQHRVVQEDWVVLVVNRYPALLACR